MKNSLHNTSNRLGLDPGVWWVMIMFIGLSLVLAGYKKITYVPCIEFTISSKSSSGNINASYYVGEDIRFTASLPNAKDVVWNFQDSTEEQHGNTVVSHSFSRDGKFDVIATINGKCQSIASVYVRKPGVIHDYNVKPDAEILITGNDTPEVNKPSVYITNTNANTYEWTILNRNEYKNQAGKIAAFSFKTVGRYTIQLKLDDDRQKIYTKNIYVTPSKGQNNKPLETKRFNFPVILPPQQPKEDLVHQPPVAIVTPPPPQPEAVKPAEKHYIEASDKYLLRTFEEVNRGAKAISEFDSYLCNGIGTKVLINNKNYLTFEQFFSDIKGNRKRKVESAEAVREHGCIISIKVTVKKKNIIGVWVNL